MPFNPSCVLLAISRLAVPLLALLCAACARQHMLSSADELAAVAPHAAAPEYVLTPGDQLEIKFFHNPELNQALPIRPDGRIALQLIGTVQAAGLTVAGLKSALDAAYATQLKLPDATIIVASFDTQEVYVGGEVKNPAVLQLKAGMTVRQAILKSGGDLPSAELGNVLVLRDQGTPRPQVFCLDLQSGLRDDANRSDMVLHAKDIVYVPKTTIAEVNQFVDHYLGQIIPRWLLFQLSYAVGGISIN